MDARPAHPPAPSPEPVLPAPAAPEPAGGPGTAEDPLTHPDPARAADAAAVENLLRCWVRETGPAHRAGELRVPLASCGTALRVPVRYWSATGHHRFGPAVLESAPPGAAPVDALTLAALLSREAAHADGGDGAGPGGEGAALIARVADSVQRTTAFLADRRADPAARPAAGLFLDGEQALLLGHPLHPTPKSREGLTGAAARSCSPELRGSFPLHWFAVHPAVLATGSARTVDGGPEPAERLLTRLAGDRPPLPAGTVPLPLHPWQAKEIVHRPAVARLLAEGLLHDLGAHGDPWYPTSSVRTVHRPDAPVMLKLSLSVRITNSRRDNLRKELHRGLEVHRLLESGLARQWHAAFPAARFDILRDPAWAGVDDADGRPVPGLDLVVRDNPFAPHDDVQCVAALTALRPWPGRPPTALTSRLREIVLALAGATGRPPAAVGAEWFLRYLETVVRPVLWLDAEGGIALEAHQQNTLVRLDAEGWPAGGWYRDNQGYYFRASRRADLARRLPGVGEVSDTFVADEVADERFLYYLGINNVLGLIGAFGAQRIAEETLLLGALRRFLAEEAAGRDGRRPSSFAGRLLTADSLRCKANLLTRLRGLDELVGPVDGQSVYVPFRNPVPAR